MIQIKPETTLSSTLKVLNGIPEFSGKFTIEQLKDRLQKDPLVLVAYENDKPVGCKIGYDRYGDGSFYSWLGGVLPEYRNRGIAQNLDDEMERRVRAKGFDSIVFKTRNKFKAMLQFAIKNRYQVVGFEEKGTVTEHRIVLKKEI